VKRITCVFLVFIIVSCASLPSYKNNPLEAMSGKWVIAGESCEKNGFTYSLSKDKSKQIFEHTDGSHYFADILKVGEGMFLLEYENETRTTDSGEPLKWWFIYQDQDTYYMKRDDWDWTMRTEGSWTRCN